MMDLEVGAVDELMLVGEYEEEDNGEGGKPSIRWISPKLSDSPLYYLTNNNIKIC
jgi:hypothetical protein